MEVFQDAVEVTVLLRRLISTRGARLVQRQVLERRLHCLEAELRRGRKSKASRTRVTKLVAQISMALCEEHLKA